MKKRFKLYLFEPLMIKCEHKVQNETSAGKVEGCNANKGSRILSSCDTIVTLFSKVLLCIAFLMLMLSIYYIRMMKSLTLLNR